MLVISDLDPSLGLEFINDDSFFDDVIFPTNLSSSGPVDLSTIELEEIFQFDNIDNFHSPNPIHALPLSPQTQHTLTVPLPGLACASTNQLLFEHFSSPKVDQPIEPSETSSCPKINATNITESTEATPLPIPRPGFSSYVHGLEPFPLSNPPHSFTTPIIATAAHSAPLIEVVSPLFNPSRPDAGNYITYVSYCSVFFLLVGLIVAYGRAPDF